MGSCPPVWSDLKLTESTLLHSMLSDATTNGGESRVEGKSSLALGPRIFLGTEMAASVFDRETVPGKMKVEEGGA